MALTNNVNVIEQCQISPKQGSVSKTSIPLSFMDMLLIHSFPTKSLFFFECSFSKSQFIDTIIPKLKNSLSQTLNHYFILASKLIVPPLNSDKKPEFLFREGDAVSLTFSESGADGFHHLVGNHSTNCSEFFQLTTERPPTFVDDSGSSISSLLAVQVTLFSEIGICIGINSHHVVLDGSSANAFLKAWAFVSQQNEISTSSLPVELMPLYDRSVMKETDALCHIYLDQMEKIKKQGIENISINPTIVPMDNKLVQATFILTKKDVQHLKNTIISSESLPHLSTFTVVCAYMWTCIVKTHATDNVVDQNEEDPLHHFGSSADARGRSKTRIPENYFGNCLAYFFATGQTIQIRGEDGFQIAVELIAEAIHERVQNEEAIFKGAEKWIPSGEMVKHFVGVAGSPRIDFQELDFGWGKTKKVQMVQNFESGAMFVCAGKEPGDVDIDLCFSREKMDIFSTIFSNGLKEM